MLNIDLRTAQAANSSFLNSSQNVIPAVITNPKPKGNAKSLNRGQRIQELSSIVQGNRIMLKKLQATKSNYSN
jgi:hypothetical protein